MCKTLTKCWNVQVHVIELGPYKCGNFAPRNVYDHIHFLDDMERYDFPLSLQVRFSPVSTHGGLLECCA